MVSPSQYLTASGWQRSKAERIPVDAEGRPLPWYTYAATAFLADRVTPTLQVFEYGCGNSTLWWAARVAHVTSIEHDADWFAKMTPLLPANATVRHAPLDLPENYRRAALLEGRLFDVIVIDGRDRINCTRHCLSALTESGVVIFDNADRGGYRHALDHLTQNGFRCIPFDGLGPLVHRGWRTSIYYRPTNCLNI